MRYNYEFKRKCVELYRQGQWAETPEGIREHTFKDLIRQWVKTEDLHGPEALKRNHINRDWPPEEKMKYVSMVMAGDSIRHVAIFAGIHSGMLYQWVRKYKLLGYNGLVNQKKGRPCKEPQMKKNISPKPLTESEREELIRLRAENEYIKAENAVIKKEIALREEKQAALLKAKKQRLSKNSEKKDSN